MNIKLLENRCDRLFKKWDSIDDPYGLPLNEFQKAIKIVNEASTISMCLHIFYMENK